MAKIITRLQRSKNKVLKKIEIILLDIIVLKKILFKKMSEAIEKQPKKQVLALAISLSMIGNRRGYFRLSFLCFLLRFF